MGFLRLDPRTRLVEGVKNVCLLDCLGGRTAALRDVESRFVKEALGSKPVEEILSDYSDGDREKIEELMAKLGETGLARMYERPYYIRSLEQGVGPGFAIFHEPTRVRMLFLELNQDCGLDCVYCRVPDIYGRGTGCGRYSDLEGPPLGTERRKDLLRQAVDLGATEVHLTGGDALLAPDCGALIEEALALGLGLVTVWTTGLSPLPEKWIANPKVRFAFLVYSHRPEVHDQVAGRSGAHAALVDKLEVLKRVGASPFFRFIVTRAAEDHWKEGADFYRAYTRTPIAAAPLYPTGARSLWPAGAGDALLSGKRWFLKPDVTLLCMTQDYHTCFKGKLAVAADGRILPCIAGRAWPMGDAGKEDLGLVLSAGRHKPYWELGKRHLPKCAGCEYRLVCFDCRVIQGRGCSLADVAFCDYDPGSGAWTPVAGEG